jgi:hypothetical protein
MQALNSASTTSQMIEKYHEDVSLFGAIPFPPSSAFVHIRLVQGRIYVLENTIFAGGGGIFASPITEQQ